MRGFYHARQFRDGVLISESYRENDIFNEGEFFFLAPILTNSAVGASAFYVGLLTTSLVAVPPLSSTMASIVQYEVAPSPNPGYSIRPQVNRDATGLGWQLSVASGIWVATSPTLNFTATNNWADTVAWAFLTTTSAPGDTSGKLISMGSVDVVKPSNNDVIQIAYTLSLK